MMSSDLWGRFVRLLPSTPRFIGTVDASLGNNLYSVLMLGGGYTNARSATALSVGDRVFIRGDVVEGPAPNLTAVTIDV